MDPDESWGQLVSLTDFDSEPIILNKSTFQIGRADGKHFSLYIIRTNCIRIGHAFPVYIGMITRQGSRKQIIT